MALKKTLNCKENAHAFRVALVFCQAIPVGLQVKAASVCSTGGRDGENGEPDGDWDSSRKICIYEKCETYDLPPVVTE